MDKRHIFTRIASKASKLVGSPPASIIAFAVVIIWAISGPIFGFSDTWQLVINTGTTIITFLMVFLIQNTQNRDSEAMHIKLDELIRATKAHNILLDLEEMSEDELDKIRAEYEKIAKKSRKLLCEEGKNDISSPEIKLKNTPERKKPAK